MNNSTRKVAKETTPCGVVISAIQTTASSTWPSLSYGNFQSCAWIFPGTLEDCMTMLREKAPVWLENLKDKTRKRAEWAILSADEKALLEAGKEAVTA